MNLKQTIQEEAKKALQEHSEIVLGTLRMLLAAIVNKEKERQYKVSKENPNASEVEWQEKSKLSDQEIQEVIASEAKKRRESIEAFAKGGRQDLADKEKKELEVLQKYLPEQLSEEQIRALVKDAVAKTGATSIKEMGKVMAALMPQVKGKSDGAMVSNIVKELLA